MLSPLKKNKKLGGQVFLDIVVLDGRLLMVHHVDALGDDVHCGDFIMLCQQRGDAHADVAGASDGDFHKIIVESFGFRVESQWGVES